MFERPRPPCNGRCNQIILLWLPTAAAAIIVLVILFASWIWGLAITVVLALFMLACTWYYFQSASPGTEPIRTPPFGGAHRETGLSPTDIAAISQFAYERNGQLNGLGWMQCAVCIATIQEGEMVRLLPICKHIFHGKCIDKWLGSNPTCPMCRADVKIGEQLSDPTCPPV